MIYGNNVATCFFSFKCSWYIMILTWHVDNLYVVYTVVSFSIGGTWSDRSCFCWLWSNTKTRSHQTHIFWGTTLVFFFFNVKVRGTERQRKLSNALYAEPWFYRQAVLRRVKHCSFTTSEFRSGSTVAVLENISGDSKWDEILGRARSTARSGKDKWILNLDAFWCNMTIYDVRIWWRNYFVFP